MHDDDEPIGTLLGRRQALTLLGAAGAALTLAGATSAAPGEVTPELDCVARPDQTEGPYFVDEKLNRSDIRSDPSTGALSPGIPLTLSFTVLQIQSATCRPLPGAVVDLWQCDALGLYSDIPSEGSSGRKFLRGHQVSDSTGLARFVTILPGWYRGRTIHHHFKIRTTGANGGAYEFTSQLYLEEAFKAAYLKQPPYNTKGTPDTTNARDGIYAQGGSQLLLKPTGSTSAGYAANFAIGLDLSDTGVGAPD
ncbi:intradiol ring-cleavage dioxygenase [Actinosynnema pretiosum subsp. pretiosum]|uniref:Intradiol ring-cleavage dioxygenase n=2 Tax=Actinosynnema TaxID=40566 RepID=C6W8M1_ACTMD|nr:intradiol ring-cleavage dioxygenase [Actinosynnema mirum]ACU37120.1 intradiol ring-cleavage dioxygenase [Actinosynnema mirum DSM 43827]AXX30610.1 putative dioxygenase [Actinosynnema pretiosum subsp. pretiosum]QUF05262.1 intradiol ring-cleavage dioxygenase [Actinosynnema pretiosum subsp. pretiosum]